jgi:hypothetical protein
MTGGIMSKYVRIKQGVPTIKDFLDNEGSPIVIDGLTGIGYYLYKNVIIQLVGGTLVSFDAFSNGFSDGFANGS